MKFLVIGALRNRRQAEVYFFRTALASCEAAFVFLRQLFHSDFLLLAGILDLPWKALSVNQRHRAATQFPPVSLGGPALLQTCCSGILFPVASLLRHALFCVTELRSLRRAHEEMQWHAASAIPFQLVILFPR